MDYEVIKLNVSNDKIREYKQFEGLKLFSTIIKSQDERTLTNKRIYVTKKNNYVYYEREFLVKPQKSSVFVHT